jgi:hypothetical protein
MGLSDFLKRNRSPLPDDDGPSPDYAFAHYALRQLALADPLRFLAIAASPNATHFIDAVLKDVAEQCGRPTTFEAALVKIYPVRVKEFRGAVIELPEPKETAEAYMVALVVLTNTSSSEPPVPKSVKGRFFSLKKGFSLSNETRTVLAECDTTRHPNYGDGPPTTVEAFVAAIAGYM